MMSSRPQPRYKPSDKIGGRYEVYKALMGGMGEVYLCLDVEEDYPLALKTFQQGYLSSSGVRTAFAHEVAIWIALEKHPNIVRCFYMKNLDNQPFMVLEWIVGEEGRDTDLRSWLRWGPLDLQTALDFIIDVCRGLFYAQQKQPGLVHRDLKPENILVAQGRLAKITDFGLSKIVQEANLELSDMGNAPGGRQSLSRHGGVVGTPPYMAPEQWGGQAGDARTDIYAIGCILYELLTGKYPYRANTLDGLRRQHTEAVIPKLDRALPAALNPLLARCLAKRPEERFTTVDDLLQELAQCYQQQFTESPRLLSGVDEFTAPDYNNRGVTYHTLQRYDEALRDYNRAIELNPRDAFAYSNRGITYADLQHHDEALTAFTQAIEFDPQYATAYYNRGNTYFDLQRYDEALADFTRAIALDLQYITAYYNRGIIYESVHCYEEALRDYSKAIELDPQYVAAYSNRGNTYESLHRYEEALSDFTQAIALDPQCVAAH